MQIELMTDRHRKYLKEKFSMDQGMFEELCKRDDGDEEFEEFFDKLASLECDAAEEYGETGEYSEDGKCAIELIDIICGPYDTDDKAAQ